MSINADPNGTFTVSPDLTTPDLSVIHEADEEILSDSPLRTVGNVNNNSFEEVECLNQEDQTISETEESPDDDDGPWPLDLITTSYLPKVVSNGIMNNSEPSEYQSRAEIAYSNLSNESGSLEELYENAAFNNESSEMEAGSERLCSMANSQAGKSEDYNNSEDGNGSSTYSESFLGRTDIFRPMLTNEQRKMLGLGSIPDLSTLSISGVPLKELNSTNISSASGKFSVSTSGGGDADQLVSKNSNKASPSLQQTVFLPLVGIGAASDTESMEPFDDIDDNNNNKKSEVCAYTPTSCTKIKRKQKRVSFSDCEDPSKTRSPGYPHDSVRISPRRFIGKSDNSHRLVFMPLPTTIPFHQGCNGKHAQSFVTNDPCCKLAEVLSHKHPSRDHGSTPSQNGYPDFRNNQHLDALAFLSSQSIKSKKLETKIQRKIREAVFDFESQSTCEELEFRRKVQALELEYQNKFLSLMETHTSYQTKLYGKFYKQLERTEKQVKKKALQGRLNEGNCFHITRNISNIKFEG